MSDKIKMTTYSVVPSAQSFGSWPTENSGWYYDLQTDPLRSRLTSVSLHCNKKTKTNGKTWIDLDAKEKDEQGYSIEPLVTSVLAEDFNVAIQNSWTPFGGDKIGELWGTLKPLAPYAKEIGDVLSSMSQSGNDADVEKGSWAQALQGVVDWLNDAIHRDDGSNIVSDYLNRVLIVQGARFTYYNGTDVNFSNLGMKFTLFSDWDSNGNFVTVNHKLQKLYPFFIGKLIRNDLHPSDILSEKDKNDDNSKKTEYLKTADEFLDRFVMWQKAPGGYEPSVDFIDACQEGTFKLKFGGYYSIPNLVIADCQLTFSRQMVKFAGGDITKPLIVSSRDSGEDSKTISAESDANGFCPLSCDVSLTFQPATKFSDIMVKALTTGYGMQYDIDRTTKLMKANLLRERARIKNRYSMMDDSTIDAEASKKLAEEIRVSDEQGGLKYLNDEERAAYQQQQFEKRMQANIEKTFSVPKDIKTPSLSSLPESTSEIPKADYGVWGNGDNSGMPSWVQY